MIKLKDFTASLVHCQVCRQIIQHLPNCRQISIVWDRKCSFDFTEKCLPNKNLSFHTRKVCQIKIRTVSQIQKTLHFCNFVFSSSVLRTFYNWAICQIYILVLGAARRLPQIYVFSLFICCMFLCSLPQWSQRGGLGILGKKIKDTFFLVILLPNMHKGQEKIILWS